jgi:hypothetical protein
MTQQPPVGQRLLIIEDSRSHSDTSHSVGLFRTSGRLVAETSTWQHTTLTWHRPLPDNTQHSRDTDLYMTTHNTHMTQTSTWQHTTLTWHRPLPDNTQHSQQTRHACPTAGFEPASPASELPRTHALDRAATGIGQLEVIPYLNCKMSFIGLIIGVSQYTPCRLILKGCKIVTVAFCCVYLRWWNVTLKRVLFSGWIYGVLFACVLYECV